MIKCNVCGCEFPAVVDKRYTARDNTKTGFAATLGRDEEKLYDAFDCPMCGCQVIVQERKRDYIPCVEIETETKIDFEDDEEEAE